MFVFVMPITKLSLTCQADISWQDVARPFVIMIETMETDQEAISPKNLYYGILTVILVF